MGPFVRRFDSSLAACVLNPLLHLLSPAGKVTYGSLPCVCVYLASLHVVLACVYQLTVKDVLGIAAVLHAPHMTKQPESPLAQEREST